ncbi:hypothetical protein F4824DRAFT_440030 [Ustulina deusta]|nr:hypothetical protein F4824DRAFT_440030 [Ustulina deusta]
MLVSVVASAPSSRRNVIWILCSLAKGKDTSQYGTAVKSSWTPSIRLPEIDLLGKANERGHEGYCHMSGPNTVRP